MAFDGIVTKAIVAELNNLLIGAKVNKVYEPNKNEIVLSLYNNGENYLLNLNTHPENYRINITKYTKSNPANALNYCMLLRKYLTGFKISSIKSFDLERIVKIYFEGNNEIHDNISFTLVIELMSRRSNIILLNDKGFIVDSLKHAITSSRELLPARSYVYPELSKISFIDLNNFDEFFEIVSSKIQEKGTTDIKNIKKEIKEDVQVNTNNKANNKNYNNISSCLSDLFIGFSVPFIDNILNELNINNRITHNSDNTMNDNNSNILDKNTLKKIYDYIKNLINSLGTANIAFKTISDNSYTISLDTEGSTSFKESINNSIDEFYNNKEFLDEFNNKKNNLLKMILSSLKKSSKKLENINKKLAECQNMDKYKLYGELITANLYKFKNVYETPSEIVLENYYDNNNLITIKLNTSFTVQKNAEKFFKKYNKLKNTLAVVSNQKKEAELELNYIESIIDSLEYIETLDEIDEINNEFIENVDVKKINYSSTQNKKEESKIHLNKYNINGFDVYVGKNNKQNDYLTLHFADKNDLWFHVQDFHGCHVILRTNKKEVDDDTIFKCALIAKQNSKASLAKNVSVDYTLVKNVRKAPGQKPGMVNYINYKTIII